MLDLAFAAMSNSNDWCGYHRKVLSSESPQPKGKVPWLVVSTPLKNISQWEGLSHILWKRKNVWNHQPARIHLAVSEQDAYPQITILVGKWWLSIGLWLALFSDKTKPAVFFFQILQQYGVDLTQHFTRLDLIWSHTVDGPAKSYKPPILDWKPTTNGMFTIY